MRPITASLAVTLACTACAANDVAQTDVQASASDETSAPKNSTSEHQTPASEPVENTSDHVPTSAPNSEPDQTTSTAHSAATNADTSIATSVAPSERDTVANSVDPECQATGDGKTTIVFVNRCEASLTVRGSDMDEGQLSSQASLCRDIGTAVETLSAKRYWAFPGADPGNEHYTLAEFTFNTDFNDFDWYNISHVDAFNLPMQIVPLDRSDCRSLTCSEDLLAACPAVGRDTDPAGQVVSCVSPDRDDGESEVALYFEGCEDAYAWSGDDQHGDDESPVAACAGEDWQITFCPE